MNGDTSEVSRHARRTHQRATTEGRLIMGSYYDVDAILTDAQVGIQTLILAYVILIR